MNLCATANATGLTLISSLISRRGDSKVSNEIKIIFRFCPYQRFRIFLFLFSLLLVFSYVVISSLLLTRWKLLLFHFDSSASSFHRKSSVCAAVVSRELLSKKKNHLLVVSELVRVIVLRRKPRVIPSSCHTRDVHMLPHISFSLEGIGLFVI